MTFCFTIKYSKVMRYLFLFGFVAVFTLSAFDIDNNKEITNPYFMGEVVNEAANSAPPAAWRTAHFFHESCVCQGESIPVHERDLIYLGTMWRAGSYIWRGMTQCHCFWPECTDWGVPSSHR